MSSVIDTIRTKLAQEFACTDEQITLICQALNCEVPTILSPFLTDIARTGDLEKVDQLWCYLSQTLPSPFSILYTMALVILRPEDFLHALAYFDERTFFAQVLAPSVTKAVEALDKNMLANLSAAAALTCVAQQIYHNLYQREHIMHPMMLYRTCLGILRGWKEGSVIMPADYPYTLQATEVSWRILEHAAEPVCSETVLAN
jgi:hypothetical protein